MSNQLICFDGNILGLQKFGGVSAYLARLASEVFDAGYFVNIIHPRMLMYQGALSAKILKIPVYSSDFLPARVAQYCRATGVPQNSVFHSTYYRRPDRTVSNYVVTVHDFIYEKYRQGAARLLHTRLKNNAIQDADTVICISERTRQDILEYVPSVNPRKLIVIPHGIDCSSFYQDTSRRPPRMDQTVLFVGQRALYKRFDLAVNAIAALPDLRLGIVGPKLTYDEVSNLNLLLPRRWEYFGHVSVDELRRLYSTAYAFIFPSDYEGFGMPVLESMACCCPVVAANCGALPEVGGNAALYARYQSPEAYVEKLVALSNAMFRSEVIKRGEEVVSLMSWRRSIFAHLNAYGITHSLKPL